DFQKHNTGTADVCRAFTERCSAGMNQIERYMNDMYGPGHSAEIQGDRFVVTKDGVPVPGFRILYIRGTPGKPSHSILVKRLPDVAHITFEELKEKLFKNIL
ncbi:hypothetical protein BGZ74_002859, partial [Mortierella antarctica]